MDWTTKKVLDHGFVHLADSMPHHHHEPRGSSKLLAADARVVQAARVSMGHVALETQAALSLELDTEERTREQDEKLINYLMKNRHTTPFEQVRFTFVVKLPIFVARQWIRHRTGSFNEMSARYTQLPKEFYVPELDRMQAQAGSNKQASGDKLPHSYAQDCQAEMKMIHEEAYFSYERLLGRGLARELARAVLPTSIYTQWFWTTDLHNLLHFLQLRLHVHAQYEIRVYAEAIMEMVERVAPVSVAAFKRHVLGAEDRAVRAEGKLVALIERLHTKCTQGESITPELALSWIEGMFELDNAV